MFGWRGRLLRVDLSDGSITRESLSPQIVREYLGGRGLGAFLHAEEVPESTAPLSPENHLIFVTGPLTGTLAPNGGRYSVVTRTPASGSITSASISGKWGSELKFAGFDAILFEGKAKEPVYLWVKDGEAEVRSAAHLAGKTVAETTDAIIKDTEPRAVVSCIGPAGENMVDCAVIVSDCISAAGGCGTGAVMGSKNLKAVAVCGMNGFRVADRQRLLESAMELRTWMKTKPIAATGSFLHESVLVADKLAWDPEPPALRHARTRGCFGCATSFSSFTYDEGKGYLPLLAGSTPYEIAERLEEYRYYTDLGMDFAGAKAILASLGDAAAGRHRELAQKLAAGAQIGSPQIRANGQSVDRGACFVAGYAVFPRVDNGNGQDRTTSDLMAVLDSVGLCPFLAAGIRVERIVEMLSAATGIEFSQDEIVQAGQRISRTTW